MKDLRFLELIHNIEVREMSTFSQVSPHWYTSAGEEAEGRVQQSCLLGRHLCSPGKHTIWTTHLSTGSVYIHVYLSIYPSIIHLFTINHSVLSICVPIYLYFLTYPSIYRTTQGKFQEAAQLYKKAGQEEKVWLFHLSPPTYPHTLTLSPHTLTLPPSLLTGHGDVHRPSSV